MAKPLSRRSRALSWLSLAVVCAALAGHVAWWYWPRERSAVPDANDVPARLLASPEFPRALWLAYPHQNLAALARATAEPEAWLGALARLVGAAAPRVPSFGPFRAPPAREICVAADPTRHQFVAVARVFPALAAVARLAGRLAGNPWLGGGAVTIEGRPATVLWSGTLWSVATDASVLTRLMTASPARESAIAWLRADSASGVLPAGFYRVGRRAGALEVEAGTAPRLGSIPAAFDPRPALLVASAGGESDLSPRWGRGAFLLFASSGSADVSLPGLAALRAASARGWRLPGAGLAAFLGGVRDRPAAGGFEVTALDPIAAQRATAMAPAFAQWLDPARPGAPSLAALIEVEPALVELRRLNRALAAIPILSRRETERWQDAERVLTPLAPLGQVSLIVTPAPAGFLLRLGRN